MYLKSLHIQGFKSFPDKLTININDGLTAVVGPNGSGKSNISDAIRWVLGEGSNKTLRSSKMEDVIFAGTLGRGPVGFAQVSLVFDNCTKIFKSEYSEIMITRRYYRSGESEFYINKKAVRLRDIHELLMDTGLGRDGYSIIGQGRIDEILGASSKDRREVFEEAAGITKYKYRKEEATKRLEGTEQNLIRIRDIIKTLEEQINPLEKQSTTAKKYLKLYDEIKNLEIAFANHKIHNFNKQSDDLQEKSQIIENDLKNCYEDKTRLYQEIDDITQNMQKLELSITQQRNNLRDMEINKSDINSHMSVMHEKIRAGNENIIRIKGEFNKQGEQSESINQSIINKQAEIKTFEELKIKNDENIIILNEKSTSLQEKISKAQNNIAMNDINLYLTQINDINTEIILMENRYHELNLEKAFSGQDILDKTKIETNDITVEIKNIDDEISSCNNMIAGLNLKINSRKEKFENLFKKTGELRTLIADGSNRLKILEDLDRNYEGFSRAIKFIMNRSIPGIYGPISSLIKTDYTLAIEVALGAMASNIVCDTSTTAKNAINILKSHDTGRATFLPVDTIRANVFREASALKEPGSIGIASDTIECDDRYKNIISNVLGRTLIVDNLDNGVKISKKYNNSFKIVTLDGQQINAGGSLTGGSIAKSTGILSRKLEINNLRDSLEKHKKDYITLENDTKMAENEYKKLDYDITTFNNSKSQIINEKDKLLLSLEHKTQFLNNLVDRFNEYLLDKENKEIILKELSQKISVNKNLLDSKQEELKLLRENIIKIQDDKQNLTDLYQELLDEISKLSNENQTHLINIENLNNNLKELLAIKENIDMDISSKNKLLDDTKESNLQLEKDILEKDKLLIEMDKQILLVNEQISEIINNKFILEGNKTKTEKEANNLADTILALECERGRILNTQNILDNEYKQILDKLWENYELTPSMLDTNLSFVPDIAEIKELKLQLKSLGAVNLAAIEQYTEVLEKYSFLTEQQEDVERAKNDILKTIDELTHNMKHTFKEQFDILNNTFMETFKDIFGGGSAQLLLEDEGDILNCGIEINVTLPGKKVKLLSLLSGGEKAFVAIALYFAILKVRPTPFCILDEIDAALDDINVLRFAGYIRKMSLNTQFMIITHRRGTMEQADMLCGVTMDKPGISRVVVLSTKEDGYEFISQAT